MQNIMKYAVYLLSGTSLILLAVALLGYSGELFLASFVTQVILWLVIIIAVIHYNLIEKEDSENP
jgi:hypothetical protein